MFLMVVLLAPGVNVCTTTVCPMRFFQSTRILFTLLSKEASFSQMIR